MHPVVYEWFKTNLPTFLGEGVPFFETQGQMLQQTNLPPMWATLELDTSAATWLSIGRPALHRESGTATAVFVAKSGKGVQPSLDAAQRFVDTLQDDKANYQTELTEPSGRKGTLRIEGVGSPEPAPFEDGNWLLCSVVCVYSYDSVRGAAA